MQAGRRKRCFTDVTHPSNNSGLPSIVRQRAKLPIWEARATLINEIKSNHCVIVVGETGSGKTTQLPQFLWEAGFAANGVIGVTQPRRVAAVTVAKRVAQEKQVALGEQVGYTIRFDDKTSKNTKVKYMTDGMLLREAMLDPLLSTYSVLILDEAHERTIHTDVLFSLVKGIQCKRPDLILVIMSATLDAEKFSQYFGAKVLYVAGRQFPVDVYYVSQPESDYMDACLVSVLQLHVEKPAGDMLTFLTGQEEIEHMERMLLQKSKSLPADAMRMVVCPIFSALPSHRQMEVFNPAPVNTRKVILATNIAETSITISNVKYIIDTGVVKQRSYNPRLGLEALTVVPISKAAARQRAGRAGREASGECYRLYTETEFDKMTEATTPEIQRCNMASIVLQLKALGISDVLSLDYLDPPPPASLKRSVELLKALQALDEKENLTPLGHQMATLPVDPMLAKLLLVSHGLGCSVETLMVASVLSVESLFYSPRGQQRGQAEAAHKRFASSEGDHITYVNVYKGYLAAEKKKQWCMNNFINYRAIKQANEIRAQLSQYLGQLQIPLVSCGANMEQLRKAIVSAFFMQAAVRQEDGSYKTMLGNKLVSIHPSSVLFATKPSCVIYHQLVYTKKKYMRGLLLIQLHWLHELAPHFWKRQTHG